jgi:RHS repeat-associated protein
LLDAAGAVQQTYQYDPFGVLMGSSGAINQPMRFSTKFYDDQTGLSYYGYRFYNPALGRWMTRDPLGERGGINPYGFVDSVGKPFSGTNLYTFTDNSPVNAIDPDGLLTIYYGAGGTAYYGNRGMVTASGGALLYSDDTPLFGGNYFAYGKQKSPCGPGNFPVKGAGAGIGPLFGFFTGNLDAFRGISDNTSIDIGPIGFTYLSNTSGWGLSMSWGGYGYGLGYYTYQTNTVAWGYR